MVRRDKHDDLPELTEYEKRMLRAIHSYTHSIQYIGVVMTISLIIWVLERFQ